MTIEEIKKLAELMQNKAYLPDCKKQISRIFRRKRCKTVIKELIALKPQIPGSEWHKALFIVVTGLLHRSLDHTAELADILKAENMVSDFYGCLAIFFGGKNSSLHMKMELTDAQFSNRYEYLTRFSGEFGYWENIQIMSAVKILALCDRDKLEALAFKDPTRFILLNMEYGLGETPSNALVKRLMVEGDDLQANLGFYFATRKLSMDMHDYEELRRCESMEHVGTPLRSEHAERTFSFLYEKSERQIDAAIIEHLQEFHVFYEACSVEQRASFLFNYVLTERVYPIQFGHWLMETELQEALIGEISGGKKLRNLEDVQRTVSLIHDFPCRSADGILGRKDKLYRAVTDLMIGFVWDRTAIYQWDEHQKAHFQIICEKLPKKYVQNIFRAVERVERGLMVSKLDEMVRFELYLKDQSWKTVCVGMRGVMERSGNWAE